MSAADAYVFLQVLGAHEPLPTEATLVLRLHDVDLRLHVPVQVRLRHPFVVTQLAVELSDPLMSHHMHLQLTIGPRIVIAKLAFIRPDV